MSTDYLFRCITCPLDPEHYRRNQYEGGDNWRSPEALHLLLELRAPLQALGAMIRVQADRASETGFYAYLPFEFTEQGCAVTLAKFFADHTGHEIHIFDEYGLNWSLRDDVCICGHRRKEHYDWHTWGKDTGQTCFVHEKGHPAGGGHVCTAHPFVVRGGP